MGSIFKERNTTADRSANDRSRHKKKIEKAIRDGVHDIIANESIIGQDGKKKIRIPVKGIREWQFVYGDNEGNKNVGSAPGQDIKRGQVVKNSQQQQPGQAAGNSPGDEFYDVEITLEELASYLFDSLSLPDLEQKRFKQLVAEKPKRHGTRSVGIPPRLNKKSSMVQRLRRKAAASRAGAIEVDPETGEQIFPFHENDLRYHHIKMKNSDATNAVIFFMMDVSGSMSTDIKFIARSFFFLLYHFIRHKYDKTEIVFIAHTTEAFETDEDAFFKRGSSGGTYVSSAPQLALNIINSRFHSSSWNIYAFHCTDGDNWPEDNERANKAFNELSEISQMVGYCEIKPKANEIGWNSDKDASVLMKMIDAMNIPNLKIAMLADKDDIWPTFIYFFDHEGASNGL